MAGMAKVGECGMEFMEPTEEEFRAARAHSQAEAPGEETEHGEDAYQVCRWFRGQIFLRERAERWLERARGKE